MSNEDTFLSFYSVKNIKNNLERMWSAAFKAASDTDKKSEEETQVKLFLEGFKVVHAKDDGSVILSGFVKEHVLCSSAVGTANPTIPTEPGTDIDADCISSALIGGGDKICYPFLNVGKCKFGNRCRYLHKTKEEHGDDAPGSESKPSPRAKTKTVGAESGEGGTESEADICYPFLHYGRCKFGGRCRYLHRTRAEHGDGETGYDPRQRGEREEGAAKESKKRKSERKEADKEAEAERGEKKQRKRERKKEREKESALQDVSLNSGEV